MRIPKRVADRELDPSQLPEAAQVILSNYLEKPKAFLMICGPVGAGKTTLCACLSNYFKAAPTIRYWKGPSMLQELKADAMHCYRYLDYWAEAELFLIDDFISTAASDFDVKAVNYLLDARRDNCRPTIITTSLPLDTLSAEIQENYPIIRPSSDLVLLNLGSEYAS